MSSPDGIDLSTMYLGLALKNPLVPSAGPMSRDVGTVRALEDAGASAIVMYSLFEEEIRHDQGELSHFLEHGTESFPEALTYLPEAEVYRVGPDEYLEHLRRLKEAVDIPIIGSLNGMTLGGWIESARSIQEAGADALELNVYYLATDPHLDSWKVEEHYFEVLRAVKSQVSIPIAVKLSPYFTSLASMARRLGEEGAAGLVLFNRFYQPDIDLENLEVLPNLRLSTSQDLRLPLRWIAILNGKIPVSLAASGGIDCALDVLKMLMAGANVTMMCSTLLRHGPGRVREILDGVRQWMEEHEYESLAQMSGSMSYASVADPAAFERANYIRTLNSYR
jgi:dihydroorotate dehydrogenase (fumarate)